MFKAKILLLSLSLVVGIAPLSRAGGYPPSYDIQILIEALGVTDDDGYSDVPGWAAEVLEELGNTAVPWLIDALRHGDKNIRYRATKILGRIEGSTVHLASIFYDALVDESYMVRAEAARALERIAHDEGYIVPRLIDMLKNDESEYARRSAAYALGAFGPENGVLKALLEAYDNEIELRGSIVSALGNFEDHGGEVVPFLIEVLHNEESYVRSKAIKALSNFKDHPDAIPALIDAMKYSHWMVNFNLVIVFEEIGPDVVPYLLDAFNDPNPRVRATAADAIIRFEVQPGVVPALAELLGDDCWDVRWMAAYGLGSYWFKGDKTYAIPFLIEALGDENQGEHLDTAYGIKYECLDLDGDMEPFISLEKDISWCAVRALGSIGEEAIPYVMDALEDGRGRVRVNAFITLMNMGLDEDVTLSAVINAFGDDDPGVRRSAILAILMYGLANRDMVPALLTLLEDEDSVIRKYAIQALCDLGPDAIDALPALILGLEDEDVSVRQNCAYALKSFGPDATQAVPNLVRALYDESMNVRLAAVYALRSIRSETDEVIPIIIEFLKGPESGMHCACLRALCELSPEASEIVPLIKTFLENNDRHIRVTAVQCLGDIGQAAKDAVPALIGLLSDEDWQVRKKTVIALARIDPHSEEIIQALVISFQHDESDLVRWTALKTLGELGLHPDTIIPILSDALDSDYFGIRKTAIEAIATFGPNAKDAIPALVDAFIDEPNKEVRYPDFQGIEALGLYAEMVYSYRTGRDYQVSTVRRIVPEALTAIGAEAGDVAPSLIEGLADVREETRTAIVDALAGFGPDVIPYLIERLPVEGFYMRDGIYRTFGKLGGDAVPALMEILENGEPEIRGAAVTALGYIGEDADNAIPLIILALGDEHCCVYSPAAFALSKIGTPAVPYLIGALVNEDMLIRKGAAISLGYMGPTAAYAVPYLIESLEDENHIVRLLVARALGMIGPEAEEAIPHLRDLIGNDPESCVRIFARRAIWKIENKHVNEG